jgi:type IV secretion system protein VirB5
VFSLFLRLILPATLACIVTAPVRAQLAVVDAPAVVQLVHEVQAMQQQVQTAEAQLLQARQALETMTGGRGMQLLLAGTVRNYLPSNFTQLSLAMSGGLAGFPGLSAGVRNAIAANAILTAPQLAALSAADQQQIVVRRQSSALQLALAQQALATTSARFASIQSLINAIATAGDQKGILDLQARITAELGMLQNEHTKLQTLSQTAAAQQSVEAQQDRERFFAASGSFAGRFQPVP